MPPRKKTVKSKLKAIDAAFNTDISPIPLQDIFDGDPITIIEKANEINGMVERVNAIKKKLTSCNSANEVFSIFSKDAAAGKVVESVLAPRSSDRQRAQETILDRSLGKVVDRTMNVNLDIGNLTKVEIDNKIMDLCDEFGITDEGREGNTTKILIDEEATPAEKQDETVQT